MEPRATVTVCCATDVGLLRDGNEDALIVSEITSGVVLAPTEPKIIAPSTGGVLLIVCDGMGGAAAGEVAARLAGETVARRLFEERDIVTELSASSALVSALRLANQVIREESGRLADHRGMGSTCTAGLMLADRLFLAQVGDSRAYLFRNGALLQLTRDQSLAMAMIDSGALSAGDLKDFPHSNVILQALGAEDHVKPVTSEIDLEPGDIILICSDGLHGPVPDEKIAGILKQTPGLGACAQALIHAALGAGGPDNVTVILARYERTE